MADDRDAGQVAEYKPAVACGVVARAIAPASNFRLLDNFILVEKMRLSEKENLFVTEQ